MGTDNLFVVAVASEKGGVGKTTIATNLAVYLKALNEDLPVTIASFDNHFSVDNMFAIGRQKGASVACLLEGERAADLALLGEYGVQFLASERELLPPEPPDPKLLRRNLATSGLSGILVLDTRPILDFFTRSALQAADLVLVPIKDRASLVNASSIHKAAGDGEPGRDRVWLLPSLIDGRLRLKNGVGMRDFLDFSARERGFQLLDTFLSKSPKVEGLATSFSSRIYPVLTHARSTAVHRQLRDLAEFVLHQKETVRETLCGAGNALRFANVPAARLRRLVRECPVCGDAASGADGRLFFDRRSRRKGFLHEPCFEQLLASTELSDMLSGQTGMLALAMTGSGLTGDAPRYRLCLYDSRGNQQLEEVPGASAATPLEEFMVSASGRTAAELFQELLVIPLGSDPPGLLLADPSYREWRRLALTAARDIRQGTL